MLSADVEATAHASEEREYVPLLLWPLMPDARPKLIYVPVPEWDDEPDGSIE